MALEPVLQSWAISSVVAEICERAGVPYDRLNFERLEGYVDGFIMTPDHDAYTGLEGLGRIFRFDACNFDGALNFIPRGGSVVAAITTDDLLEVEADTQTRRDAINVPRVMHLSYYDLDGGLTADKQTSDRSLDARAKSEVKSDTAVIMRAQDAAQANQINHKVAIEEQRGNFKFALSSAWAWLTTGDLITINGQRVRIVKCEVDDGMQSYECNFDRQSAYVSYIEGVPAATVPDAPTLILGETAVQVIDSHILRDADDRLGYYVAVAGLTLNWTGCVVEVSKDGGQNYIDSAESVAESAMGELLTALPMHSPYYPDELNTVTVQLLRDDMELYDETFAGVLNRGNLAIIGNELVNFQVATEISPGVWELSGLLRGRKGSAIPASHAIGERFVLLERSQLFYVGAELFELGRQLTFRATSFGLEAGTVTTLTFAGNGQRERQPAYLEAVRGATDTVYTWQGVGRIGGGASVAMGQYFAGYRLTIGGVAHDLAAMTFTGANPSAGTVVTIQQLNALTGPGPALTITI